MERTIGLSRIGRWLLPTVLLVMSFVPTMPAEAYTFEKSFTGAEAESAAGTVANDPYLEFSDTYPFPARGSLLAFLFEHLDVTGSLAKASRSLDLRVRRRTKRSYSLRTKRDLEGYCYRLKLDSSHTRYVGRGTYRQDYVPFDIRGTVLMDLSWVTQSDGEGVIVTVRLRMIPSSRVVGLIGTIFYPLVRLAMVDILDRVVEVGREFAQTLQKHPELVGTRLQFINPEHARLWREFQRGKRSEGLKTSPFGLN